MTAPSDITNSRKRRNEKVRRLTPSPSRSCVPIASARASRGLALMPLGRHHPLFLSRFNRCWLVHRERPRIGDAPSGRPQSTASGKARERLRTTGRRARHPPGGFFCPRPWSMTVRAGFPTQEKSPPTQTRMREAGMASAGSGAQPRHRELTTRTFPPALPESPYIPRVNVVPAKRALLPRQRAARLDLEGQGPGRASSASAASMARPRATGLMLGVPVASRAA
jgi:hypothetical protein